MALTEQQWDELIERFRKGTGIPELIDLYNVNKSAIVAKLFAAGENTDLPPRFDEQQTREINEKFRNGAGIRELSKEYNSCPQTIGKYIHDYKPPPSSFKQKEQLSIDELYVDSEFQQSLIDLQKTVGEQLDSKDLKMLVAKIIKSYINNEITILNEDITMCDEKEIIEKMATQNGKLTKEQITEIIKSREGGESYKSIAKKFGVSIPTIKYHIKRSEKQLTLPIVTETEIAQPAIDDVTKEIDNVLNETDEMETKE